jgi:hypothetical protein
MPQSLSRRALQATIAVLALVPISGGLAGAAFGPLAFGPAGLWPDGDSHFRYLSGLLLAIGLAWWATIPHIERRGREVRLLTSIVVIGGLARLATAAYAGLPGPIMTFALVMELLVTPAIWLWQRAVAKSWAADGTNPPANN